MSLRENPEKLKEYHRVYDKKWRAKHPEQLRLYRARWRGKNKDYRKNQCSNCGKMKLCLSKFCRKCSYLFQNEFYRKGMFQSGSAHPRWGSINSMKSLKKFILKRDGFSCQCTENHWWHSGNEKCLFTDKSIMEVDHKQPRFLSPERVLDGENLFTMCPNCHRAKTNLERKLIYTIPPVMSDDFKETLERNRSMLTGNSQ